MEFASANWLPIASFREGWYIIQKDPGPANRRSPLLRRTNWSTGCWPWPPSTTGTGTPPTRHGIQTPKKPSSTGPRPLSTAALNQRLARAAAFLAKQWPGKSPPDKDDGLRVVQQAADDRRHFLDEWDH